MDVHRFLRGFVPREALNECIIANAPIDEFRSCDGQFGINEMVMSGLRLRPLDGRIIGDPRVMPPNDDLKSAAKRG